MKQEKSKILSHGSIYLLGNILRRAISFIMLPIYTRCLSPQDYGTIELLSMIIDFISIIFGLKITQAIFRYYGEYKAYHDKNEVISTSLFLCFILNCMGIIVITIFIEPITLAVFGNTDEASNLLFFSLILLFQPLTEIPMAFIRAKQKPWIFIFFSIIKLSLQLGLNIYLVVIKKMHIEGVIYSAVLSGAVISFLLIIYTFSQTGSKVSWEKSKKLTSFSIPMILTSIISFYIAFGDRYFLRVFSNLKDVGIYALGYKFGFLLNFLIATPFASIWDSEKYKIYKKADAANTYQNTFIMYNFAIIALAVGISVFIKDLIKIMASPHFWPAYGIVPIILSAYVFNAWAGFTNLGILIKKNTIEITYGTIIAAILATIGYYFFIPRFGAFGAAWSTVIAFGARFIWITLRANRYYNMNLPWKKVVLLIAIGILSYLASRIGPHGLIKSLIFNFFIMIAFGTCTLILPIFPPELRHVLLAAFKNPGQLPEIIKQYRKTS